MENEKFNRKAAKATKGDLETESTEGKVPVQQN
jgi:hypothetical protein